MVQIHPSSPPPYPCCGDASCRQNKQGSKSAHSTKKISSSKEPTRRSRKRKRKRLSYKNNNTMARRLVVSIPSQSVLSRQQSYQPFLLEIPEIRDAVGDHAYRRVMLFYYQAVVYYKMGCDIERGKTLLQYGKACQPWTSAAHSSILPSVIDNFFERVENGQSDPCISRVYETLRSVKDQRGDNLLNRRSFLFHSLSTTVELPHSVNEYDTVIEGVMREKGIEILNRVSKEGLWPYAALAEFVAEMHRFFDKSEAMTLQKIEQLRTLSQLEGQLKEIEKQFSRERFQEFVTTAHKVGECYKRIKRMRSHTLPTSLKGRLTWERNYFSGKAKAKRKTIARLQRFINQHPEKNLKPVRGLIEQLEFSLKIIALQRDSTALPPLDQLSGRVAGKRRVPMTEQELFEQKITLLKEM